MESLASFWRALFLLVATPAPFFYLLWVLTKDSSYRIKADAMTMIGFGGVLLFIFSAPREYSGEKGRGRLVCRGRLVSREAKIVALSFTWLTSSCVLMFIGSDYTDWFWLSMVLWFNVPATFICMKLRRRVAKITDMSDYLYSNVLVAGISSLVPMLYLTLEIIKCLEDIDEEEGALEAWDQCSGVSVPTRALTFSLGAVLYFKVILAPLSETTVTKEDILKLNVSKR